MKFNLKDLRERKGFSQTEFAAALNGKWAETHPGDGQRFTTDMVVRMEKDPDKISLDVLSVIIRVFGVTFDQLLNPVISGLSAPKVKDNWGRVRRIREGIERYIAAHTPKYLVETYPDELKLLGELKERITRKTKIACIGRPDSGKSRTINTLLGRNILPTNWTPTTSAFVLIKHIEDKPAYFGADNVWVFRDGGGGWNPDNIGDEKYCREWCLAAGDHELIGRFGAHGGANEEDVGAIVVYVDSDILHNCDLIDLPGFNPQAVVTDEESAKVSDIYDSRDSMLSARASRMADGFIYLSIANSFLYGDDLAMAQSIVKALPMVEKTGENDLPPFGNLFFVASQALTVDHGDTAKLGEICDKAAERLWAMVSGHPAITERRAHTGHDYSQSALRSRFFTSEMDSPALTETFHAELARFVEMLPVVQERRAIEELRLFCDSQAARFQDEQRRCRMIVEDHEAAVARLRELEQDEPRRAAEFRRSVYRVTDIISGMRRDCERACSAIFDGVIDPAHIVAVIDRHGLKKNKRDLQELVTLLNAELENALTAELTEKSDELKGEIDTFIAAAQVSFTGGDVDTPDVSGLPLAFNVGRAFASGLSGAATFGALAAWAATCGNLGGYVLVAKAVSLLASLGIHLGGTSAVISAVSAIGGPVVLGIAIAVIATLTSILALGGTWKKLIGNRLVKQYRKKDVLGSLIDISENFWNDTMDAFRAGTEKIEQEWREQMDTLRDSIADFSDDALIAEAEGADAAAGFFRDIFRTLDAESAI